MPVGFSLVILMEFWRMGMGKKSEGIDVSHRRKSSLMVERWEPKLAMIFSSSGMNDLPRWQFCSKTQSPVFLPVSRALFAVSPWPCPRETTCMRSPKPLPRAKSMRRVKGSAPGERMKMMGVVQLASLVEPSMLNGGGSMKWGPRSHFTNWVAANTKSASRETLMSVARCICVILVHFSPSGLSSSLQSWCASSNLPSFESFATAAFISSRPGRVSVAMPTLSSSGLAACQFSSLAAAQTSASGTASKSCPGRGSTFS
mmetsp:Transcript_46775/g.83843  ORF Transcript_46775/g.83843 Transcript_46775/m.83843 type:complete len:258 (+) Transcript_46775:1336-2109(+)